MFKKVYNFSVIDEIKAGNTVCVLDKATREVFELNSAPVSVYCAILEESDTDRFVMWTEEVTNGND